MPFQSSVFIEKKYQRDPDDDSAYGTFTGTEEDKAKLQRYKKNFNQYAKRRIFECLPEFGPISDANHADIFVKLDSQYDNYKVAQIERFCHKLSEILRVSFQGILRLCRVDEGCLQLMFQVPIFVQQEIFPLSREQGKALVAVDVIKLTCGEYQFKVKCLELKWMICANSSQNILLRKLHNSTCKV